MLCILAINQGSSHFFLSEPLTHLAQVLAIGMNEPCSVHCKAKQINAPVTVWLVDIQHHSKQKHCRVKKKSVSKKRVFEWIVYISLPYTKSRGFC